MKLLLLRLLDHSLARRLGRNRRSILLLKLELLRLCNQLFVLSSLVVILIPSFSPTCTEIGFRVCSFHPLHLYASVSTRMLSPIFGVARVQLHQHQPYPASSASVSTSLFGFDAAGPSSNNARSDAAHANGATGTSADLAPSALPHRFPSGALEPTTNNPPSTSQTPVPIGPPSKSSSTPMPM
ncbi:hypothetical protein BT96DRAFT_475501 [Gymnopus androsaceus JB14]|uniref:Uncharacterized protein n=1 Tax=Gymnopus androsaceus JB14 TaxID=1447944 RepID=A0A6A4GR16_9AGAR|nr:hypothetical protein BT96DRAFT_475501 [Gymnopus androsaceus JB14]